MGKIVMHVEPAARRGREHIVFQLVPVLVCHRFVAEAVEILFVFALAAIMRLHAGLPRYRNHLFHNFHVVPERGDHRVLHGGCARLVRKVVLAAVTVIVFVCTVLRTVRFLRLHMGHAVSERICFFHVVPLDFVFSLDIGKNLVAAFVGTLIVSSMPALGAGCLRFVHPLDLVFLSAARRKRCYGAKQKRACCQNADQFFVFHNSSLFVSIFD